MTNLNDTLTVGTLKKILEGMSDNRTVAIYNLDTGNTITLTVEDIDTMVEGRLEFNYSEE